MQLLCWVNVERMNITKDPLYINFTLLFSFLKKGGKRIIIKPDSFYKYNISKVDSFRDLKNKKNFKKSN